MEYDFECQLDHLITSVQNLGREFLAGSELDFVSLANARRTMLENTRNELLGVPIRHAERDEYLRYLSAADRVLEAIKNADLSAFPLEWKGGPDRFPSE
jgi:hypothetical protein